MNNIRLIDQPEPIRLVFELARADEGREGALIQVVDVAQAPEKKSKPQRALLALGAALLGGFLFSVLSVLSGFKDRRSLSS